MEAFGAAVDSVRAVADGMETEMFPQLQAQPLRSSGVNILKGAHARHHVQCGDTKIEFLPRRDSGSSCVEKED